MVWIGSSIVIFLGLYLTQCISQRRLAAPWQLHLPGVIVLCVVLGFLPAYVFDIRSSRQVELPPELQGDPEVPLNKTENRGRPQCRSVGPPRPPRLCRSTATALTKA